MAWFSTQKQYFETFPFTPFLMYMSNTNYKTELLWPLIKERIIFSPVCTEQKLQKVHLNVTKNVRENIEIVDSCNDFNNNYFTVILKHVVG